MYGFYVVEETMIEGLEDGWGERVKYSKNPLPLSYSLDEVTYLVEAKYLLLQ